MFRNGFIDMKLNYLFESSFMADGQDIHSWRYHRLHERTSRENQQFAARDRSKFNSVE